jgi:signal transduction histidine kinase
MQPSFVSFRWFQIARLWLILMALPAGLHALQPDKPITQYSYENWQTERGLPQNSVNALCQTRDGYLWVATFGGLARFDGAQFTVFEHGNTPEFPRNWVTALHEDRTGRLWIQIGGSVVFYEGGRFSTPPFADRQPGENVSVLAETRAGEMLFGTSRGRIFTVREGRLTQWTVAPPLNEERINTLYEDAQGRWWLGGSKGLYVLEGRAWRAVALSAAGNVWAIRQQRDGRLWVGTERGLAEQQNSGWRWWTTREGLRQPDVRALQFDRDGNLWLGTYGGGMHRLSQGRLSSFSRPEGLPGDIVTSFCEDREGSLWVGTLDGGLHRFHDNSFVALTTREGLSKNVINALAEGADGSVWLGTSGAGVDRWREGRIQNYGAAQGLQSERAGGLHVAADGTLWMNGEGVLHRFDGVRFHAVDLNGRLRGQYVRGVFSARDGSLWVNTDDTLYRQHNGAVTVYANSPALPVGLVYGVVEDEQGAVWFAQTGRGLLRFKEGAFTAFSVSEGLGGINTRGICRDANGALWVADGDKGLTRFKDGRFTHITTREGLFSNELWQVLADDFGYLWLSSVRGLFRISLRELDELAAGKRTSVNSMVYGAADGLKGREVRRGIKTRDGLLWFASPSGVLIVDPRHVRTNQVAPLVLIETMRADNRALDLSQPLELAAGTRHLEFRFAGLSLLSGEHVRYRYQLSGLSEQWIEAGTQRQVNYANLAPGRYRLRVLAANHDGVWSVSPAEFEFTLLPHFYQTKWFYLVCVAALGLLALAFYRRRLWQLRQRYAAVFAERDRIAGELHDTLEQGLAMTLMQLEWGAERFEQQPNVARRHLDFARQMVRHNLDEAKRYVWDLHAHELENADLLSALRQIAAQQTRGTEVQTDVQLTGKARPLPLTLSHHLLRIGQEAISNALKHAEAQRIEIQLSFETAGVRLRVRDDGRGFDAAQPAPEGHFGLQGMKRRARRINGQLQIHSQPGGGACIEVSAPFSKASKGSL